MQSIKGLSWLLTKAMVAAAIAALVWNAILGLGVRRLPLVVTDPKLGKIYSPGSVMLNGTEGFAKIVFDQRGFNNPPGPELRHRVLVLGDSFSEATQVPQRKNFSRFLERKLSEGSDKWQVINCGIAGSSVANYLYYGAAYLETFDPEWTVVQVSESDFSKDAFDPTKEIRLVRDEQTGEVRPVRTANNSARDLKNQIVSFSPFTAFAYEKLKSYWRAGGEADVRTPGGEKSEMGGELHRILAELKAIFGSRLVILEIPDIPMVVCDAKPLADENSFTSKLKAECGDLDIRIANPRAEFVESIQLGKVFPTGFANTRPGKGHLNVAGHRLVAEVLYETITRSTGEATLRDDVFQ